MFAVNLSGHQIGNDAVFNHAFPANSVTVGNGKTIHAVLGIVDTGNFRASACKPVTAAGLKVFAPTGINEVGRIVPFPFSACSTHGSHAPNSLDVTPAHPGRIAPNSALSPVVLTATRSPRRSWSAG